MAPIPGVEGHGPGQAQPVSEEPGAGGRDPQAGRRIGRDPKPRRCMIIYVRHPEKPRHAKVASRSVRGVHRSKPDRQATNISANTAIIYCSLCIPSYPEWLLDFCSRLVSDPM